MQPLKYLSSLCFGATNHQLRRWAKAVWREVSLLFSMVGFFFFFSFFQFVIGMNFDRYILWISIIFFHFHIVIVSLDYCMLLWLMKPTIRSIKCAIGVTSGGSRGSLRASSSPQECLEIIVMQCLEETLLSWLELFTSY